MKLNATPRHYMPLPQNQSDDDESGPSKEDKGDKLIFKNSFDASEGLSKRISQIGTTEINPKNLPMSPIRLTMFIISLITCVLFVIIFVFLMPCTISQDLNRLCHLTHKWKKVFYNMSFTSPLDFVDHGRLKNRLVILGFEGTESGLIAINERSGREYWRLHLHSLPLSSYCNVIDVNSDGLPECLIVGGNGLFAAIDVEKGISLWYLHNHSDLNDADSIDGPIIVPDCDDDGIADIIISYSIGYGTNSSYLALVSGGTGQIIGSLIELQQCVGPSTLRFTWESQNEIYLVLHCSDKKNDNLWLISLKDILGAALNETVKLTLHNIFRIPHFVQDIQFYPITESGNQLVIVLDGAKFILLEKTSLLSLQIIWNIYIGGGEHMRIITDGVFVNGGKQLVITSSDVHHSKIIGLSLIDGQEMWSILHDNGTVTAAIKLPKFFDHTDGLLLKILSSPSINNSQVLHENLGNSSNQIKNLEFEKYFFKTNTRLLQESYIFVKCGKIPVIKTIQTEEVFMVCKGNRDCHPNVYTTNSTVLVKSAGLETSFDMLTVTSTVLPASNTEKMIIKYWNLKNTFIIPRCTG